MSTDIVGTRYQDKEGLLASSEDRRRLQSILGSDAEYVRLRPGTKKASSSLKKYKNARMESIPPRACYGVLPKNDLIILDIDVSGDCDLEDQLSVLEEWFGFDRQETFTVSTPSGGLHVYLRVPENTKTSAIPQTVTNYFNEFCKLSPVAIDLDRMTVDIRRPGNNSYVCGPDSYVVVNGEEKLYKPQDHFDFEAGKKVSWKRTRPQRISEEVAERLCMVKELKDAGRKSSKKPKKPSKNRLTDFVAVDEDRERDGETLCYRQVKKLQTDLRNNGYSASPYHSMRAYVYNRLKCCYSPVVIANTCQRLGIDRDSHRDDSITGSELFADIYRLDRAQSESADTITHGGICSKRMISGGEPADGKSVEQKIAEKVENREISRRKNPTPWHFHSVVDIPKAHEALLKIHPRRGRMHENALRVLRAFIAPVHNLGGDRAMIPRSYASEVLELSTNQVTQAVRSLVKAKVIRLRDRQRTGMSATYVVNNGFFDQTKGVVLRKVMMETVAAGMPAHVLQDDVNGGFIELYGKQRRRIHTYETGYGSSADLAIALEHAFAYSRREALHRQMTGTDGRVHNPDLFLVMLQLQRALYRKKRQYRHHVVTVKNPQERSGRSVQVTVATTSASAAGVRHKGLCGDGFVSGGRDPTVRIRGDPRDTGKNSIVNASANVNTLKRLWSTDSGRFDIGGVVV